MKRWLATAVVLGLPLMGCEDDGDASGAPTADMSVGGSPMGGAGGEPMGGEPMGGAPAPVEPPLADCDALDPEVCAYPWPSSLYLVEDETRGTGYTLSFGETTLPANRFGTHIRPEPFQRMDGYPLSVQILARFPGVDTDLMAKEGNIEDSMAEDAPILLFEAGGEGLKRIPYMVEPDARFDAEVHEGETRPLFVRPAVHLREGTRYVVAFRGLVDAEGAPIPRTPAFDALLSGNTDGDEVLTARKARFDEVFGLLEGEGVDLGTLTLAWDFHTASTDGLHTRMLHMRDEGLAAVGEDGPELRVEAVETFMTDDVGEGRPGDVMEVVRIRGKFTAPNYLKEVVDENGVVGYEFNLGADGLPEQNGTRENNFWILIPSEAFGGEPHTLVQYGHGLFGSAEEVLYADWTRPCGRLLDRPCGWFNARAARDHKLIYFGADLTGMAQEDRDLRALALLADINKFVWIGDRLHQGMMEWLLLTRAVKAQFGGLEGAEGITVNDEIVYSGISQGGIFGAAFVALSPEISRGHLGVPGVGYNRFLERSTGFTEFFVGLTNFYPSRADQTVLLEAIQILWDSTENSGYMWRLSHSPFEGQVPNHILAAPTRGDYLVPPISYEVVGRTCDLNIGVMTPYDADRAPAFACEQTYPHTGSGIVQWNLGNPWPEPGNVTPPEHPLGDPHEDVRQIDAHQRQMAEFLKTGEIIDVCDGEPCTFIAPEEK